MKIIISKNLFYFLFSFLILATSCQKEIDIDLDNPPPVPDEVKDSTLLIKSITLIYYNDSITEYYFYDTVNRKITISWDGDGPRQGAEGDEILTYNSRGLLSQIKNNYVNPGSSGIASINFTYDEEGILQKLEAGHASGNTETLLFSKVRTDSAHYQLSWKTPYFYPVQNDSTKVSAVFDNKGKFISQSRTYPANVIDTNGNNVSSYRISKDSLVYDATGNLSQILRNDITPAVRFDHKYTEFEFTSRETKGDQLYNHRMLLLNGIANIPFGDEYYRILESVGLITILISELPRDFEYFLYLKYPFSSANLYNWGNPGEYDIVTGSSEFDSKNRLVLFTPDPLYFGTKYRITYYK